MSVTQKKEKQIEGQEQHDYLNHGALDERRTGGGHPDGARLDGSRQVLSLQPGGQRLQARMGFKRVPPLAGLNLRRDKFRAMGDLPDELVTHEGRQPEHYHADHQDGEPRHQTRALYFRLAPSLHRRQHDGQSHGPHERGQERHGQPVTEVDSKNQGRQPHQRLDVMARAPVVPAGTGCRVCLDWHHGVVPDLAILNLE